MLSEDQQRRMYHDDDTTGDAATTGPDVEAQSFMFFMVKHQDREC